MRMVTPPQYARSASRYTLRRMRGARHVTTRERPPNGIVLPPGTGIRSRTVTMPPAHQTPPTGTRRLVHRVVSMPSKQAFGLAGAVALMVTALVTGLVSMPFNGSERDTTAVAATPSDVDDPRVVLVGIAGLAWSDVTAENTPTLYSMAGDDAVASLTVRTVRSRTCEVDGWLTAGAGRRATDLFDTNGDDTDDDWCRQVPEPEPAGTGDTVTVPGWDALRDHQDEQS